MSKLNEEESGERSNDEDVDVDDGMELGLYFEAFKSFFANPSSIQKRLVTVHFFSTFQLHRIRPEPLINQTGKKKAASWNVFRRSSGE